MGADLIRFVRGRIYSSGGSIEKAEEDMMTDLWDFALTLYARPGVEADCLALQAEGADVCQLLCAAWLAKRGVSCTLERLRALQDATGTWQEEVVAPLRLLRRQWREKAASDTELVGLREQLKRLELDSERVLLRRLEERAIAWPETREATWDWMTYMVLVETEQACEALQRIIDQTHAIALSIER
jgi:uncharacterized protein (TIGR02444 family)